MLTTWPDAQQLLSHFKPREATPGVPPRIGDAPEDVDRIFDRRHADEYPSLTRIGCTYAPDTPRMLVFMHLKDYCNVEGVTEYESKQLYDVADVIVAEYGHLNAGEIMLFFRRLKAGKYGHMYGNRLQGSVVTGAIAEFMAYRSQHMQRIEQQRRDAARDASSARAITYAEYCRGKVSEAAATIARAARAVEPA